ncbi:MULTISPECIES: LysR substrate-binding domain-containing protein [unclassified Variovorax]|uniref:LysR substrate-binding domain-containing protein n=1 Tax=unclassified Variovorax TaxID=663243 RepID=UPI0008CCCD25|nr:MULTISPECIES: LysR substrate-binding domain-containing protein [unclassified Variovorax]SEJ49122.1 DNA-binding transcriptional regulator, LysR family [Variovorax sp. OK202]SFC50664.1 DNA-binding transcriptional regulator, LysR family [Variovorax sp. OK212]
MELRHIRYFVAVAEQLHFSRAAEALGISPPTLTVQIKELEENLQARLFSRTNRSVALTSAGEAFLVESRALLAQADRTLNVGRRAGRGEIGRIEIGYVGSAVFSALLQDQVRAYRAARPDVMVKVKELPMDDLPALLEDGRIDMAFVRMPVVLSPSLASHVLVRDRFCVALPADHPLARAMNPLPAKAMAHETFVVPEQDWGLLEVARRGRFNPQVSSAPGGLLAVLTHVSLGVGIAIVPSVLMQFAGFPNVIFLEIAGLRIASEVAAVFRRHEKSPTVQHLIEQMRLTVPRPVPAAGTDF